MHRNPLGLQPMFYLIVIFAGSHNQTQFTELYFRIFHITFPGLNHYRPTRVGSHTFMSFFHIGKILGQQFFLLLGFSLDMEVLKLPLHLLNHLLIGQCHSFVVFDECRSRTIFSR